MTELSPAARVVFESFNSKFEWIEDGVPGPQFSAIAAALRAAANYLYSEVSHGCRGLFVQGVSVSAETLEEIATELEAQ